MSQMEQAAIEEMKKLNESKFYLAQNLAFKKSTIITTTKSFAFVAVCALVSFIIIIILNDLVKFFVKVKKVKKPKKVKNSNKSDIQMINIRNDERVYSKVREYDEKIWSRLRYMTINRAS